MATVRLPNGQTLRVPDDATAEQVQQYAASAMHAALQEREFESARQAFSTLDPRLKFLTGIGAAAAEPVMGLKQAGLRALGKDTTDLDQQIAAVRGAREGSGGFGTAGEITGWIGTGAAKVPALVSKALPAATRLGGLLRPAVAGATEQAAYEGSRGTLEGDPSRAERAAVGAAGGGIGGTVGHALPKVAARIAEPIRASDAARAVVARARQLGEDIDLTVGQAVGNAVNALEESLGGIPIVGRLINRAREGAGESWNRSLLNDVVRSAEPTGPSTSRVTRSGAEGIEEAQRAVKAAYREALAGRTLTLHPNAFDASIATIQRLPDSDAAVALKVLENAAKDIDSGKVAGDAITRLRSEVDDYASKAYREGNYPLGKALDAVGDDIRTLINSTGGWRKNLRLQQADAAYAKLADINRAAAMQGAVTAGGRFTPAQLINAQRRGEPASMVASQRVPGMKEAVQANEVLGNNYVPKVGPGTAEKLLTTGALAGMGAAASNLWDSTPDANNSVGAALLPASAYLLLGTKTGRRVLVPALGKGKASQFRVDAAELLRNQLLASASAKGGERAGVESVSSMLGSED